MQKVDSDVFTFADSVLLGNLNVKHRKEKNKKRFCLYVHLEHNGESDSSSHFFDSSVEAAFYALFLPFLCQHGTYTFMRFFKRSSKILKTVKW